MDIENYHHDKDRGITMILKFTISEYLTNSKYPASSSQDTKKGEAR